MIEKVQTPYFSTAYEDVIIFSITVLVKNVLRVVEFVHTYHMGGRVSGKGPVYDVLGFLESWD